MEVHLWLEETGGGDCLYYGKSQSWQQAENQGLALWGAWHAQVVQRPLKGLMFLEEHAAETVFWRQGEGRCACKTDAEAYV